MIRIFLSDSKGSLRKLAIFTLVFIVQTSVFAGGGWPQQKGSGYFKLGYWGLRSDKYFAPNGDILDIATAGVYSVSIYGEYGITDRLTGVAYFPFFSRATLNRQVSGVTGELLAEGDAVNSIGDTDLTLKYALIHEKPVVMSLSLTLGLPLGNNAGGETGVLQTGDGEFNKMLSVDVSGSIPGLGMYFSTMVGFNDRSQGFSDEFRYGLELGGTYKSFTLLGRFTGIKPLNNGNDFLTLSNGVFSNNLEYLAFSPELIYTHKDKFGVTASVGTAIYGKRILANPSTSFGIFYKL